MMCWAASWELDVHISSQLWIQWHPVSSLKLAIGKVFIPWKLVNTTNHYQHTTQKLGIPWSCRCSKVWMHIGWCLESLVTQGIWRRVGEDETEKFRLSEITGVLECQSKKAWFVFIGTPPIKKILYDTVPFVLRAENSSARVTIRL